MIWQILTGTTLTFAVLAGAAEYRGSNARTALAELRAQVKADGIALARVSEAGIKMTELENARNRVKEQEQQQREELATQALDQALVVIADTRADTDRVSRLRDDEARARRRAAADPGQGATVASCGRELETTGVLLGRALQVGGACALGAEADNATARSVFKRWPMSVQPE